MTRAILFDIDGTLVDSNAAHIDAWAEVFAEAGLDVPRDAIADGMGMGADNLVPALVPGATADEAERLGARHGAIYKARWLHRVRPFPGARDLLRRVRDSGRVAVLASSGSEEEVAHYTRLLDADGVVAGTTSADDVKRSKPAPDIFAAALETAGVGAAEAVAVGDTPYDAEAAAALGVRFVGVLSGGFDGARLRAAGAAHVAADVAELLARFDAGPLAG